MGPFEHAVVGIDGRHGGRDAIALAQVLAAARLTLVSAYSYDPTISPSSRKRFEQILRDDTVRSLEATRLAAGAEADLIAAPDPSPARALQRTARTLGADLIVVGSAHHGRAGRVLMGDVGRAVLHDSPCAVAVAPDRFAVHAAGPRTVIVGFDGSAQAWDALRRAEAIAAARQLPLHVCVVCADPPMLAAATAYAGTLDEIRSEDAERAARVLANALARLPAEAHGEVRHGRPATELAAAAGPSDLIVVGSRGWGTVRRIALGSTADRLVHDAPCPVLVLPRPATAEDRPASSTIAHQEVVA